VLADEHSGGAAHTEVARQCPNRFPAMAICQTSSERMPLPHPGSDRGVTFRNLPTKAAPPPTNRRTPNPMLEGIAPAGSGTGTTIARPYLSRT
jgi:hypothetical protein